ncbi:MAG TPA: hypothetical protein VGL97_07475 [Bryobacteraceae bacterium]
MKSKNNQKRSLTGPLVKELVDRQKAEFSASNMPAPSVGSIPLAQPDLYQDPGQGYNPDFTFPQD